MKHDVNIFKLIFVDFLSRRIQLVCQETDGVFLRNVL
jgi:hypothetical protein